MNGEEVHSLTLLGKIVEAAAIATSQQYVVDDGTGAVTVQKWVDADDAEGAKQVMAVGQYVRVYGHVRVFQGQRNVIAFSMRPVTDFADPRAASSTSSPTRWRWRAPRRAPPPPRSRRTAARTRPRRRFRGAAAGAASWPRLGGSPSLGPRARRHGRERRRRRLQPQPFTGAGARAVEPRQRGAPLLHHRRQPLPLHPPLSGARQGATNAGRGS